MAKSNLTIQSRFTVQRREQLLQPYQQRLAAARAAGDSLAEIDALTELGRAWLRQRDYVRAVAAYEQQLAILRLLGNSPGEAEALSVLSGVYLAQGEYRRALLAAEQSLDIQHRVGGLTAGSVCDALLNMAASYAALGNLRGAAAAYEEELAHARASGLTQLEAFVLDELGQTYVNLDQPGRAIKCLKQELELRRRLKDCPGEGRAHVNLGCAYFTLGRTPRALHHYQLGLAIYRQLEDSIGEYAALNNLGTLHLAMGDRGAAAACYEQQLDVACRLGDCEQEARARENLKTARSTRPIEGGDWSELRPM